MTAGSPPVSRLVVLAPNWLGDAVMALPAVADIRRYFPAATVAVAARPGLAPLFGVAPGVDEVLPLAASGRALVRGRADASALEAGRFDLAVLFPHSFYAAWIARRARIPERWGYRGDWRTMLLTRPVRRPRGRMHLGERYQRLLQECGISSGPLRPRLTVPRDEGAAGRLRLAREGWAPSTPLVGLAPGAAFGFAKQWPPDRFASLARRLAERGVSCVLVGLPADRAAGQRVMAAFERAGKTVGGAGTIVNLVGRTTLEELMGVMTHCESFVANDSGAAHLAAAIGLPVVTIFGPTDERITAPLQGETCPGELVVLSHPVFCRPCHARECPIDHRCMKRIEPERVFEAVVGQLAGRGVA